MNTKVETQHLLNNQIKSHKIMLLDKEGQKIGDMSYRDAMQKAYDAKLDLMQVGENGDIAICKLLNYESWLYHENKKRHKQEFKNRSQELKTINFRPVTGENDFKLKLRKVAEFLDDNHKVKIVVKFKNYRESTMDSINKEVINKIIESINEHGEMDGRLNTSPKEMSFIIKPNKKPVLKMKP